MNAFRMAEVQATQVSTVEAVRVFMDSHGYAPSIRELAHDLGITSTAAWARVESCIEAGLIEWPQRFGKGSRRWARTMKVREK